MASAIRCRVALLLTFATAGLPQPPVTGHGVEERLHAFDLLKARKFADLNRMIDALQLEFEKDYHAEQRFGQIAGVFQVSYPELEPLYAEWVRQYPDVYVSHLARGYYYTGRGKLARGSDFADKTSPEQFKAMDANFAKAIVELRRCLQLRPKAIMAYHELLDIDRLGSADVPSEQLLQQALHVCPACYILRRIYQEKLEPRWGGSYKQMQRFADDSMKYAAVNPKIRLLGGFVEWDKGHALMDDQQFAEAIPYFTRALTHGDHSYFYYYRALCYQNLEEFPPALSDVNHAVTLEPDTPAYYFTRSQVQAKLRNFDAALADLHTARALNPNDKRLEEWGRTLTDFLRKHPTEVHHLIVLGSGRCERGL